MQVFCISLDKYLDRWPSIVERFTAAGLPQVIRSAGVLGQITAASVWNRYRMLRHELRLFDLQIDNVGAVGCFFAHRRIWERMVHEKIPQCLIFEDDVLFLPEFMPRLQQHLADAPPNLSMLLLHSIRTTAGELSKPDFYRLHDPFISTLGYMLTLDGAKKLLALADAPIEMHLDGFIGCVAALDPSFELYALRYWLCKPNWRPTDINHSVPFYKISRYHFTGALIIIILIIIILIVLCIVPHLI
jgi:glycosyl transferase family 25